MHSRKSNRSTYHLHATGLRRRERGVALAISLVLMVAMTILGVATLSSTRLNEQITGNAQQKTIIFEAAESAIHVAWSLDRMLKSASGSSNEYNDPSPTVQSDLAPTLSEELDQTIDSTKSVDVVAEVSIQYCGENALPEGSNLSADESRLQYVGHMFDVNGVASVNNTHARADHLQRGMRVGPKTGRTGACILRRS